jgi:hypothetical protein
LGRDHFVPFDLGERTETRVTEQLEEPQDFSRKHRKEIRRAAM